MYQRGSDVHKRGEISDWFIDLVDKDRDSWNHWIVIQFGSIDVNLDQANEIVDRMLTGLNEIRS